MSMFPDSIDFYPRPPRGGRQKCFWAYFGDEKISIHALREEGDAEHADHRELHGDISIHALREEGDICASASVSIRDTFLSTPSARRATGGYSPPPRYLWISIHALREEGDRWWMFSQQASFYFYPRPPRGGRQTPKSKLTW